MLLLLALSADGAAAPQAAVLNDWSQWDSTSVPPAPLLPPPLPLPPPPPPPPPQAPVEPHTTAQVSSGVVSAVINDWTLYGTPLAPPAPPSPPPPPNPSPAKLLSVLTAAASAKTATEAEAAAEVAAEVAAEAEEETWVVASSVSEIRQSIARQARHPQRALRVALNGSSKFHLDGAAVGLAFVSRLRATGRAARPADSDGALWEQLQTHKAAIFPTELFGDLVELLETELTDAIAQAARGSGFGPQDSESSVSSHGGLKSKRRSETKQDAFALFDRHGFESVLRASDRLYKHAMREVRRTRQTTTS